MKVITSFPRAVRDIEHCWIPTPDGCRLAARIWLPDDAETRPVPGIIEYIPYGKRWGTRERDEPMHRYFAGHGYAAVRIDVRGSGESEGILTDEYTEQEHRDGVAAIAWVADQPWCTGRVGMIGKSWGGFNALQIAAEQPPALEAIVPVCSTDDRYADDAHYMGGCLIDENLMWGSVLFTLMAQPPDPELVGDRWRAMWLDRLQRTPLFVERWLCHQHRDDYWKHGSVCEDFSRIRCPVYAIGGWADGYTNAVPRLLAGLTCPKKGLVGPWAHLYPHTGVPGPAIGFLQEALRWWDYWLKGHDTGIMDEPMYRVWMQDGVRPQPFYQERPGRWVAEPRWPSPRIRARRLALNEHGLADHAGPAGTVTHSSAQTVGLAAGDWCGFGVEGELPTDQRQDDERSLTFDSPRLDDTIEILGAPELCVTLSVDQPSAVVAVRLNDIGPDGSSTRVTYGLLNLAHRCGHDRPEPLVPGTQYRIRVRLNDVAHSFAPGHRFRVAISTAYWPLAWPSPEPVTLAVATGESFIELPVRPPREQDAQLAPFAAPEGAPRPKSSVLARGGEQRTIVRDTTTGEIVYTTTSNVIDRNGPALMHLEPIDLERGHAITEQFRMLEHDPLSMRAEITHHTVKRRRAWSTRVATWTALSSTADEFHLEATLEAHEGDCLVFSRRWTRSIPRRLV